MLKDGLYEQIISNALSSELRSTDRLSQRTPIDGAEAPKVLARYVAEVVEQELRVLGDSGGKLPDQVAVTNRVLSALAREMPLTDKEVAGQGEQLLSLFDRRNRLLALNEKATVVRPETSIAQSSLFTGAAHEPQMYSELKKEILSCNRIDMLVSFIKWSGLRMLQMFYVTIWGKTAEDWSHDEVLDNLYALADSPVLLGELLELLRYQQSGKTALSALFRGNQFGPPDQIHGSHNQIFYCHTICTTSFLCLWKKRISPLQIAERCLIEQWLCAIISSQSNFVGKGTVIVMNKKGKESTAEPVNPGAVFREARLKTGKSQDVVADEVAFSVSLLSDLENGRFTTSKGKMKRDLPLLVRSLAQVYKRPELEDYFCTTVCPIGQQREQLRYEDIGAIRERLLTSLTQLERSTKTIVEMLEDGEISPDEWDKCEEMLKLLRTISRETQSAELWAKVKRIHLPLCDHVSEIQPDQPEAK